MKGKLIGLGWQLENTHNLAYLLKDLGKRGFDFVWYSDAADILTTEYIADRYPGFNDASPDREDLRGFLELTLRLFENLSDRKYTGPVLPA